SPQSHHLPKNSFLGKLFNLIFCLTVYGCFAYGSYTLYQTVIRPYFSKSVPQKDAQEEIRDELRNLSERIAELSKNVSIVHEFVRTYCQARDESMLLLKSEIASVKSLLVSRNNFPSAPTIPKWQ